jgi:hypothetical protein
MRRGIAERISRAKGQLDQAEQDGPNQQREVLLSLGSPFNLEGIREIVRECECKIIQLQKTIGELQMAFPVTNDLLFSPEFEGEFKRTLTSTLEFRITTSESYREAQTTQAGRDFAAQENAAVSRALAELRETSDGRPTVNGLLLSGKASDIRKTLKERPGTFIAVEVVTGSRRPFAVPLDVYKDPPDSE